MAELPKQPSLVSKKLQEQFKSPTQVQKDVISGAQFGEAVVGEGLGRLGTDPTLGGIRERLAERTKGFTGAEETARREQALERMSGQSEAQRRALQASLARSGVKGGAAGQALLQQAAQAGQQRAGFERDFLIQQRAAEGQALQEQLAAETGIQQFDLSQAAKEKNIALQTGLGFAGIGAQERGAKLAADAAGRAAGAMQSGGSGGLIGGVVSSVTKPIKKIFCHLKHTEILMENGEYKNIQDLELGDITKLGGKVVAVGQAVANENIYKYNGELMSGGHLVWTGFEFVEVKNIGEMTNLPESSIVYPIATENGVYVTKGGYISGDVTAEKATFRDVAKVS